MSVNPADNNSQKPDISTSSKPTTAAATTPAQTPVKLDSEAAGWTKTHPELQLCVDKETAYFPPGVGGRSEHMLVNTGEQKLAVKIRCSNNKLYRVVPVYMFVDAGQAQLLIVSRLPGGLAPDIILALLIDSMKQDKLVVQFIDATPDAKEPKTCFLGNPTIKGHIRINLKVLTHEEMEALVFGEPSRNHNAQMAASAKSVSKKNATSSRVGPTSREKC